MSGTYTDLRVWQISMQFVTEVYRSTLSFPKAELYGLTSQMRRAAVSIPSNIAEGKGRSSDKELAQFLNHARGSLFEIETQLELACRLGYLDMATAEQFRLRTAEIGKLINGLLRSIRIPTAA
jgi:four helix bundle protein